MSEGSAAAPPLAGFRVLLVEDDELVAMMVEQMLSELGCGVTWTSDGTAALGQVEGGDYDLLVCDIRLGGRVNGVELARTVSYIRPGFPVLLATGWAEEEEKLNAASVHVLRKPFTTDQLQSAVLEIMGAAH